ncbi:hypothetical protein [Pseudobutyrivibrio sp.]
MKTKFNYINCDWTRVKNHCRTTVNKKFTDIEPTEEFKQKLLISEHSPIRLIEFDWTWENIPSWVTVHFARHKWEKFISTQRNDRTDNDIPRDQLPQGALVNFDGYCNVQNLIDTFRKRLCYQASPETREYAEDFKIALGQIHPEIADVLVPNCIYRCGCPEFQTCGFFKKFLKNYMQIYSTFEISEELFDIQSRYSMYNALFDVEHGLLEDEGDDDDE